MSTQLKSYQLTRHPLGSFLEMWTIAWPLILALLSTSLMMFADRLFLAQYSVEALTAAAHAGTAAYAIFVMPITIIGITEVFVGQYHADDQRYRMGEFTWQMIWLSIFLTPLFYLLGKYLPLLLFAGTGNEENETIYFRTIVYFGSLVTMIPALMGYFAGQGKVKIITIAAVLANLVNCGLDWLLIFGWNFIPELGIYGAAIGTVIASLFQILFFLCFFFRKEDRENNGTTHFGLNVSDFWRCIKIGFPAGIAHLSEMIGHLAFFRLMILADPYYMIIASMMQSFYLLTLFLVEGLSKAVTAISSNLIGASVFKPIGNVVLSACRLQCLFAILVLSVAIFLPERLLSLLLSSDDMYLLKDPLFFPLFKRTVFWVASFFLVDGLVWSFIGLLTAAGDTRFIMLVGVIVQWLCYFLPVYIAIRYLGLGVDTAWMLIVISALLILIIYVIRYRNQKWKFIKI